MLAADYALVTLHVRVEREALAGGTCRWKLYPHVENGTDTGKGSTEAPPGQPPCLHNPVVSVVAGANWRALRAVAADFVIAFSCLLFFLHLLLLHVALLLLLLRLFFFFAAVVAAATAAASCLASRAGRS
jgi:hypothetical protein